MAESASAATGPNESEAAPPPLPDGVAKSLLKGYCLAHSSWKGKGKSQKVCAFCGVKKKNHTEPLLMPEPAVPEILEVSESCENPSSSA